MPAFHEWLELHSSYLKVIGCLCILAPQRQVLVSSEGVSCAGIQQSRQNRRW